MGRLAHWHFLSSYLTLILLRVGPIFENSKCSFFGIHFSTIVDVSIVLNLPIVSLFFKSHPWLHDANKQIQFLKMHYVENLIVIEKSTTSITFFEA